MFRKQKFIYLKEYRFLKLKKSFQNNKSFSCDIKTLSSRLITTTSMKRKHVLNIFDFINSQTSDYCKVKLKFPCYFQKLEQKI